MLPLAIPFLFAISYLVFQVLPIAFLLLFAQLLPILILWEWFGEVRLHLLPQLLLMFLLDLLL